MTMIIGVAIGIVVGALPGLSATLAVALMLPFTFGLAPETGILLLVGAYCGGVYGGSITAILIKTPGTPASVASVADGFSLTRQGRAYEALMLSLVVSVVGGLLSGLALLFIAPQIATVALRFGPPEFFALAVFGLTIIASVSGKSMSKGMIMAAFGLLFSCVGFDKYNGEPRFIFGQRALYSGIQLIPAMIGVFAIAEVFNQVEEGAKSIAADVEVKKNFKPTWKYFKGLTGTTLISSIIGIIIGAIPGTGGAIASFVAYNGEQSRAKDPETFGKGNIRALAAAETGKNATTGATLIPMLTLGIPGDTVTAILLGALTIHGLSPGPRLFVEHGNLMYTVMLGFFVVNILMLFEGLLAIKWFSKIVSLSSAILLPIILVTCLLGAFASNNQISSVTVAVAFGVFGYVLSKFSYPMAPMLIAMILGPIAEVALRQSLVMSDGNPAIFVQRPLSLVFLILAVGSLLLPVIQKKRRRRAPAGQENDMPETEE